MSKSLNLNHFLTWIQQLEITVKEMYYLKLYKQLLAITMYNIDETLWTQIK